MLDANWIELTLLCNACIEGAEGTLEGGGACTLLPTSTGLGHQMTDGC